ncbi:hypothetical protein D3C72_1639240 [compost metagenome]
MVDQDAARRHGGQQAALFQNNLVQVVIVADTGEDELGTGSSSGRRGGAAALVLLEPGGRAGRVAVVHGDVVPARRQMACHGETHDAQTDECHFCHIVRPVDE